MRIKEDVKLDFNDVLIVPKRSTLASRSEVTLERTFHFSQCDYTWTGIPIAAANMDVTGTVSMASALSYFGMLTCLSKYADVSKVSCPYNAAQSFGIMPIEDLARNYNHTRATFLCLDVANGYTETFVDFVKTVRKAFPKTPIIAGNVATPEMTEALVLAGADIVKVGIGSGALCLTRRVTGVGYPQLSAVMECADAAHGLGGFIMSDGGCVHIGDIAKAFCAGADFVMLGSMLSAFDECGGVIDAPGGAVVKAYGMSSDEAMAKHGGKKDWRAAEGRSVVLRSKGPVKPFIQEVLGGLRSACTYIGASRLKDMPKRATFIRVNRQLNTSLGD